MFGKSIGDKHIVCCPGRDGDMQNLFRPRRRSTAGRIVNGLLRHGDPGHIPKCGGQLAYPVRVQCGHVQAVHISLGCLDGKYRQHVRPVRGLSVQGDRVIVPGLQQLQAAVVGHIDRPYRLGHGTSALRLALVKLLDIFILQELGRLLCGDSGL